MNTDDITLFHRIVEAGSLVDAADLVRQPKSTVSRKLKGLEDNLGVKLFHRQSRSMTLTTAGSHFYQKTLKVIADLNESINEISAPNKELTGHLKIQIFPIPDIAELTTLIFQFMDAHPNLSVEIISTGEYLDMVKHNIDLAFHIEEAFSELDMVARPVITSRLTYLASPVFLAREGYPKSPEDIVNFNTVIYRFPNGAVFDELPIDNQHTKIKVSGSIITNEMLIARQAAINHKAIAFLPTEICQEQIASGQLVPIFDDLIHKGHCLLVYPSKRFVSLAAQKFIEFITNELTIDGKPRPSKGSPC